MDNTVDKLTTSDDSLSPEYRPVASPAADTPPAVAGETEFFQHYQVLRREDGTLWELGRGAMGITYRAFDTNLRCPVALKVISAQHLHSDMAGQRFIREARVAARLRHRNIASVYHLGVDPQNFFYSMEFVDGETLEDLVERVGPLPLETVLNVALQTSRALAAAARQGLIHRDIKPANLMVLHEDEEGEEQLLVKVIDFGLARSYDPHDSNSQLTATGFVGTPLYASPEQLEEHDLDIRSDIYSLGITLWILLAGKPPFEGKMTQVITQHLNAEPPWWQLGACPEPARALLERMLKKDPRDRFQTAHELRRAIEDCMARTSGEEGVSAAPPVAAPRGRPTLKNALRLSRTPAGLAGRGQSNGQGIGAWLGRSWKPVAMGVAVVFLCAVFLLLRRSPSVAKEVPRPSASVTPSPAQAVEVAAAVPLPTAAAASTPVAAPGASPVLSESAPSPTATDVAAVTPGPIAEETPAKLAADLSSLGDPQLRAEAATSPDASPAVAAATPAVSPSPEAAKDDPDGKAADGGDADAKGVAKTTQRTRSRRPSRSAPTPQPNFFQRMFGIKPKPTPRNR